MVITAFEWKSQYEIIPFDNAKDVFPEDVNVIITEQKPPEPPKKIKKVIPKDIIEIKNDEKVPEDVKVILDIENLSKKEVDSLLFIDIQDEKPETYDNWVVESLPLPKNGYKELYSFIVNNLRYPIEAQRLGIEGRITIRFVVNEDGEIVESEILKGIGAGCDKEALRVLNLIPAWTPGKQRGKPVRVRMVLPITFKLN